MNWLESVLGLCVAAFSSLCFCALGELVARLLTPTYCRSTADLAWKWKNILVSFIHSSLTGSWAVLCFYHNQKMVEDMIETYTAMSHCLIAVSIGYFLADTRDMIANSKTKQSLELIFHHCMIVLCFGIAVVTQRYEGYALVALLVELNSVFLHLRQLLQFSGFTKNDPRYRLNSLLNLGTFVVFRIATLAWMTRWLVVHRDLIPLGLYTVGSVCLAIITLMNIVLFYRLLRSDFIRRKDKAAAAARATATSGASTTPVADMMATDGSLPVKGKVE